MKNIYLLDSSILSPLGFGTSKNIKAILQGKTGISQNKLSGFFEGKINTAVLNEKFNSCKVGEKLSRLEKMLFLAVQDVLEKNPDLDLDKTLLILSTTKGNIDSLEKCKIQSTSVYLSEISKKISRLFKFQNKPITICNACISGGLAIAVGKRFIQSGQYENALIAGGDILSQFVTAGFQSFQAISKGICQPYSKNRDGINLGEAAACLLLGTGKKSSKPAIKVIADSVTNDANHISGPSRNGEGLIKCVKSALLEANLKASDLDYISAHGTATVFNDEMEAIAFNELKMSNIPINSFKSYFGHTLGASALIETIITKEAMLENVLIPSLNYKEQGTSQSLNVITEVESKDLNFALKTASGFGGCNLALILQKE